MKIKNDFIGKIKCLFRRVKKLELSQEAGTAVSWTEIVGKPTTFAPIVGTTASTAKAGDWTPTAGDIPNLATSKITSGTFADARIPSLAISKITGLQGELDNKADSADIPDVSGFATTSALTTGLSGKANTSHTHTIAQVTNLQTELNNKLTASQGAAVTDAVDETDVVAQFNSLLASLRASGVIAT